MLPAMNINYLAVLTCAIVAMPVGFLWFGPLFGRTWARHMGLGDMQPPDAGSMGKSMAIFFFSNLLIAWPSRTASRHGRPRRGGSSLTGRPGFMR